MPSRDDHTPGTFSWVDLMTPDPEGAKTFYGALFGWRPRDQVSDAGPVYTMFERDGKHVAGMGGQPPDMKAAGAPPVWNSYVTVEDAEAIAHRVVSDGGTIAMPVMKIMTAGSMAFLADPAGARFAIWQPDEHRGAQVVGEPGTFFRTELITDDPEGAKRFYAAVFGWTFEGGLGPDGTFSLIRNGGALNGGLLPKRPEMGAMPNHWSVYFRVASIDAAIGRCHELGGSAVTPVMDLPGYARFAVLADPSGGNFEVIEVLADRG